MAESEYVPATSFYLIHRFRGEEDLAFEWLKRACSEHDTFLPLFKATPGIIPEGSKYMSLLKEVGPDFHPAPGAAVLSGDHGSKCNDALNTGLHIKAGGLKVR